MSYSYSSRAGRRAITVFFWAAFAGSCFLFWWLESTLLRIWPGNSDPIQARFLWISAASLVFFTLGYITPAPKFQRLATSEADLTRGERFSYLAAIVLAVPAFWVAVQILGYRLGVGYLEGHGPSLWQQAVLYTQLFFGLLYVGAVKSDKDQVRKIALVVFLTVGPRLLVALRWRRFFLAQAVLPIIFIMVARGWLKLDVKRTAALCLIALFILFIPAITRGDKLFGADEFGRPQLVTYFGWMTTLKYFQDNLALEYQCSPLAVSLTAKLIPYKALGICTVDIGRDKGLPATTERLLTKKYTNDIMKGTGSNYLLDLYLTGGYPAIILGTIVFGFTCRRFAELIDHRSLYAGIWAECLSRALLAPRGTLGYVYERIPGLLLATFAVILLSRLLTPSGTDARVTTTQEHA